MEWDILCLDVCPGTVFLKQEVKMVLDHRERPGINQIKEVGEGEVGHSGQGSSQLSKSQRDSLGDQRKQREVGRDGAKTEAVARP